MPYCVFFSGSCWAEEELDAPPEDEDEGCAAESLLEEPDELGVDDEPLALGVELELEDELGAAEEPPLAEPELLGCCAPELLELELSLLPLVLPDALGVLPPPEAEDEPDLAGSVAPLPLAEELDEPGLDAPGVADDEDDGLPALPPTEAEPELEPGELGGVEDAELLLPLLPPLVLPADFWLSWPQAARPNARATATARVESFMNPPWLG